MLTSLTLLACGAANPDTATLDSAIAGETGAESDGNADSAFNDSGESGESAGDTATPQQGLAGRRGSGNVSDDYQGVEESYFVADRGDGTDVCRVSYVLQSVGERPDCGAGEDTCDWAFDIELSAAALVGEADPGCAGVGIDPLAFDGLVVSYGFIADYYGHTSVLVVELEGVWTATSFASFRGEAFEYDWEYGLVDY